MDGVTILNTIELEGILDEWMLIMLLVLCVAAFFCAVALGENDYFTGGIVSVIICVMCLITIIVTVLIPNGKYKYEVTIDPSVSMTEFYEHYEVLEQRGNIWVVKEKEQ